MGFVDVEILFAPDWDYFETHEMHNLASCQQTLPAL
jgi:hypothetical protein